LRLRHAAYILAPFWRPNVESAPSADCEQNQHVLADTVASDTLQRLSSPIFPVQDMEVSEPKVPQVGLRIGQALITHPPSAWMLRLNK
ncbi:hypothetical protein KCU89_g70, partial [Aureobasidium melanogenum]